MELAQPKTASHPSPTASAPRSILIEKGVPVPKRAAYRDRVPGPYSETGRALAALEVGDSFIFPRKKRETIEAARTRAYAQYARLGARKFQTRIMEHDGARVLRVWRIA